MANRTRQTTSVSTLVTKTDQLITYAVANKRKDILRFCASVKPAVDELVLQYETLRKEIDPLHARCFPKLEVSESAIALALAEIEETEETEKNV